MYDKPMTGQIHESPTPIARSRPARSTPIERALPAALPRRRDAVQRREALLNAAAACFETRGYSVPLEEIADLAGVGRGTLYRNFRDRVALALAIFEREIDELNPDHERNLPLDQALRSMVFRGARMSSLFTRMAAEVDLTEAQLADFKALGQRAQVAMEPLVSRAHAAGQLRKDIGPAEVLTAVRMLSALCKTVKSDEDTTAHIDMGLSLLMGGLAPR
ncbi:TetR/AcrR family transcriptional regulator [Novosphingobium terrae]|uniref:TetR/AcrR family transcriptional regulator n=1 Tax=Novosphingobium terrae TaxID=2726189 RepID=UPI00198030DC|nr:TetR/AcrR family transcriptional regulator [Novosphingobium terrae]